MRKLWERFVFGPEAVAAQEKMRQTRDSAEERAARQEQWKGGPLLDLEVGWSSEGGEHGLGVMQKEAHVEMPGGPSISATCDMGGPGSKYTRNEDGYYICGYAGGFVVMVYDGAGGSGYGEAARDLCVNVTRDELHDTRGDFELAGLFSRIPDSFASDTSGRSGYATGVGLNVRSRGTSVYEITSMARGDSRLVPISKDPNKEPPDIQTDVHNEAYHRHGDGPGYYTDAETNVIYKDLSKANTPPDEHTILFNAEENPEGFFAVMGTDGLWDVVSPYEATMLVQELHRQGKTTKEIEEALFRLAYGRNNTHDLYKIAVDAETTVDIFPDYGRGDNITVVVVDVQLPKT